MNRIAGSACTDAAEHCSNHKKTADKIGVWLGCSLGAAVHSAGGAFGLLTTARDPGCVFETRS